jgi:hypothetical protein
LHSINQVSCRGTTAIRRLDVSGHGASLPLVVTCAKKVGDHQIRRKKRKESYIGVYL